MREIIWGALAAVLLAFGALLIAAWPSEDRPVMAFFPPGTSAGATLAAVESAGGKVLQSAGRTRIVSVGERSGYILSLYRSGAWLVLDAAAARICFRLTSGVDA